MAAIGMTGEDEHAHPSSPNVIVSAKSMQEAAPSNTQEKDRSTPSRSQDFPEQWVTCFG